MEQLGAQQEEAQLGYWPGAEEQRAQGAGLGHGIHHLCEALRKRRRCKLVAVVGSCVVKIGLWHRSSRVIGIGVPDDGMNNYLIL